METIFTDHLGASPKIKILEFLIEGRGLDYSLTDITEGAEVAWKTTLVIIPELVKLGMVVHTRDIGNARLFKINKENKVAQKLIEMFDFLLSHAEIEETVKVSA